VLVLGGAALLTFIYLVARRIAYPFDLEWMEGGMLLHAQRIARGEPLYGPPVAEFVPYLYTPLYPALLALLGKVFGIRYWLGRLISILSLLIALFIGGQAARRSGARWWVAFGAAMALLAAFPNTAAWYDLVRSDELFLALAMGGFYLVIHGEGRKAAIAAGALLALSYFAKQVGMAAIGVGLFVATIRQWRTAWVPAAAAAVAWIVPVLLLNHATSGWYWSWAHGAHLHHRFYWQIALVRTPLAIFAQAPAIFCAGLAAIGLLAYRRQLRGPYLFWGLVAAGAMGLSCVASGTAWAVENAYIPALLFALVALAVLDGAKALPRWLVPAALSLQLAAHVYDPRPYCPTPRDEKRSQELVLRIARTEGEVLFPFHPYYTFLAGKTPWTHGMGIADSLTAGYGSPRGLEEGLAEGRFAQVIVTDEVDSQKYMPGLAAYHTADWFPPEEVWTSFLSVDSSIPSRVLVPRPRGAKVLWRPSFFSTLSGQKTLVRDLVLSGPSLTFDITGTAQARECRVELLDGAEVVRTARGEGLDRVMRVRWDTHELVGRTVRVRIVDESDACRFSLHELWE
jgi:hypothetical protein